MPSDNATLLILGCGPGVGLSSAIALATPGHFRHIILCSRNEERLQQCSANVRSRIGNDGTELHTIPLDLEDIAYLPKKIAKIKEIGELRCVLFNAARIKPSQPLEASVEELQEDLRISTLALYIIAQETIPLLSQNSSSTSRPAFIVTNSHLPESPAPEVLILSVCKAAQQNMVQSLDAAFGGKINFSVIKIKGTVGPEDDQIHPEVVAGEILDVYQKAWVGEKRKVLIDIDPYESN